VIAVLSSSAMLAPLALIALRWRDDQWPLSAPANTRHAP
jgi:hypothetical protein